jgi:hypothetical protein
MIAKCLKVRIFAVFTRLVEQIKEKFPYWIVKTPSGYLKTLSLDLKNLFEGFSSITSAYLVLLGIEIGGIKARINRLP